VEMDLLPVCKRIAHPEKSIKVMKQIKSGRDVLKIRTTIIISREKGKEMIRTERFGQNRKGFYKKLMKNVKRHFHILHSIPCGILN
jgi:hypothetical protein